MLLDLIKHQVQDVDKIYLYVKGPLETKYQLFINRRKKLGTEQEKNQRAFIGQSKKRMMYTSILISKSERHWIVQERYKTKNFTCFDISVVF